MKKTNLEVVYRKTAELIPYANNARTHSEEQVTQIASSIKEFGFNNPILVDGENGVIAGHGRLLGAKKLGLEEVPTIELKGLTEAQKKAYILADNKIALNSGWDEGFLSLELKSIQELGSIDSLLATGFEQEEIDNLLETGEIDFPELNTEEAPLAKKMTFVFPTMEEFEEFSSILEEEKERNGCSKEEAILLLVRRAND